MYTTTAYSDLGLLEGFPHHGVFYKLAETVDEDGDYGLDDDDEDEEEEDSLADNGDYGLDDDDTEYAASESADADDEEAATDETDSTDGSSDSTDDAESSDDDSTEDDDEEEDSSEIIILETPCDIQQNTALFASATITRGYKVYFPFNPDIADLPSELKPGILFRGECHGLTIAGTVLDPVASELGVCMVEIRGTDI